MKDFRLTDFENANVKSEKVEKWETTPVFFWKIIGKKLARFMKNSYLCIKMQNRQKRLKFAA